MSFPAKAAVVKEDYCRKLADLKLSLKFKDKVPSAKWSVISAKTAVMSQWRKINVESSLI